MKFQEHLMVLMKLISVIIFDLGNVIVDLSHYEIAAALAEKSTQVQFKNPYNILLDVFNSKVPFTQAFDKGKQSTEEFFKEARNRYSLDISLDEFSQRWNTSFRENTQVTTLMEKLLSNYRLFLMSNTNPLHYAYLKKSVPILSKLEQTILSYEVGHVKPSPSIFEVALKKSRVPPEQILFIDDSKENIHGAEKFGIQGIVYESPESLKESLNEIL